MSPVLDVMAVALLTLHDAMNGAQRSVLAIVVQMMSQLPLLTLMMALINVAASVAAMPVLVEVGAKVAVSHAVRPRLVGVVLVELLLDGGEFVVRRSIRSTARAPSRSRHHKFGCCTLLFYHCSNLWCPRFSSRFINPNDLVKHVDFGQGVVNLGHHLENLADNP
jgi:hypothetical protein